MVALLLALVPVFVFLLPLEISSEIFQTFHVDRLSHSKRPQWE